jgi:hypothetical protein
MTDDRRQLTACYPEVITRALICTVLPLLSTLACKAVTAKTPHVRRLAKMECISLDALASRGHTDAETPTRHTLCKRNSRYPQIAAMERESNAQCSCYYLPQAGRPAATQHTHTSSKRKTQSHAIYTYMQPTDPKLLANNHRSTNELLDRTGHATIVLY